MFGLISDLKNLIRISLKSSAQCSLKQNIFNLSTSD